MDKTVVNIDIPTKPKLHNMGMSLLTSKFIKQVSTSLENNRVSMLIRIDAPFNQQLTIKRKGKRFLGRVRARCTSPDKGVPDKQIGAVNLAEKSE